MSTSSNSSIKLKLIPFKGKVPEWERWKRQFVVRSLCMGYKDYMEGTAKPDPANEEEKMVYLLGYHDLLTDC